jgi:hypothetical protein
VAIRTVEKIEVVILEGHVDESSSSKIELYKEDVIFINYFRNKLIIQL